MNHLKGIAPLAVLALTLLAIAAGPASATVLTDGAGNQLKTGAFVTAETEGSLEQHTALGSISCAKSHFAGKTSNDGGAGVSVNVSLETLSWSGCGATFTTLRTGTLSINWTSGNNGALVSTGAEWTTTFLGLHCIYSTNNTKLGTVTGGTPATLDIEATLPRTGGSSGSFCGSTAQWTGSFEFTSPTTINIDKELPVSTILTDGAGTQLKTGTSITAQNEGGLTWHPPIGEIKCGESHLGGKTTNDGGGGASVNVNLEALSWSKCNATVTVLAKGSLAVTHTSGSDGVLSSTGTELTIAFAGFHCIFKTSATKLGTLTGSASTGGKPTLDIEASIPRTGGSSGAFCGTTAQWTGAYELTSPSTMNID